MTPEQSAAVARLREDAGSSVAGVAFVSRTDLGTILAALDEAQADAARYQVLRNGGNLQFCVLVALTEPAPVFCAAQGWEEIEGEDIDAAIDAARAGEKP
jgi:hypothetical protein